MNDSYIDIRPPCAFDGHADPDLDNMYLVHGIEQTKPWRLHINAPLDASTFFL